MVGCAASRVTITSPVLKWARLTHAAEEGPGEESWGSYMRKIDMRRADQVIAGLVILLGVRFALVAPREFDSASWPWATGFWLVNCAVLFVACGAVQLVRIRTPRLRPACGLSLP